MKITETAQDHFRTLLVEHNQPGTTIRIMVTQGGTPTADIAVNFCGVDEAHSSDIPFEFEDFKVLMAQEAAPFLKDALIDFQVESNGAGGELCIKAPHLKTMPTFDSLQERIQYVIDTEIAPGLASHGGFVKITDVLPENGQFIVVLEMGGGCHGCSMAKLTLKQGIERTLKERFPEIAAVQDATVHETGENPYY